MLSCLISVVVVVVVVVVDYVIVVDSVVLDVIGAVGMADDRNRYPLGLHISHPSLLAL